MSAEHIGQEVRRLREARNWSLRELARRASMTPTGVRFIEQGVSTPSSTTVEKLARAFNLPPGDLYPKVLTG